MEKSLKRLEASQSCRRCPFTRTFCQMVFLLQDLSYNVLSTEIPIDIVCLELSNNLLIGGIPSSMQKLSKKLLWCGTKIKYTCPIRECVPSLNNSLYSISSWKVVIKGFYSVWFKPKTGGCKGGSVLKGLSTGCVVTFFSLHFSL